MYRDAESEVLTHRKNQGSIPGQSMGQCAWDLGSPEGSARGICGLQRAVRVGFVVYKSIPRWICRLQRAIRVGFVVYEGQFAWDLRSTEGTKIQMCWKYVEMVLFLSWAVHGSNPGGGKTLLCSPKRPYRL
jgi:hypothetical protein